MKLESYKNEFSSRALDAGYSQDEVIQCLRYAEPLINKSLPVIYNTSHLSALVGYNTSYLRRAVKSDYQEYFYRKHVVPKKNKGIRYINEPLPSLKEIQKWILDNILHKIPISRYAKGYVRKRNIKDHVRFHKNQKVVITLDIEDFFDEIRIELIEKVFLGLGYSKLVSDLLSKLCSLHNSLPQGAPTSPVLSNTVLVPFDDIISKYCTKNNLRYTRYADDLAFSGDIEPKKIEELIELVSAELDVFGLYLNKDKTLIMGRNQRQIISGVVVNDKIQVPRKKRDELRQAMYFIETFGLESHLARINCTKSNYLLHLLGIANYIVFINPKDAKTLEIRKKLYSLLD